jgi:hypothetical protein
LNRAGFAKDLFFQGEVGVQVDLGGFDRFVTQPDGDECAVYPSLEQFHRSGVAEYMRRHSLFGE